MLESCSTSRPDTTCAIVAGKVGFSSEATRWRSRPISAGPIFCRNAPVASRRHPRSTRTRGSVRSDGCPGCRRCRPACTRSSRSGWILAGLVGRDLHAGEDLARELAAADSVERIVAAVATRAVIRSSMKLSAGNPRHVWRRSRAGCWPVPCCAPR